MEELGIFLLLVILMVVILYYTNRKEGMWGGGGCGCGRGCRCPFCRWNTMRSGLNNMPNYM